MYCFSASEISLVSTPLRESSRCSAIFPAKYHLHPEMFHWQFPCERISFCVSFTFCDSLMDLPTCNAAIELHSHWDPATPRNRINPEVSSWQWLQESIGHNHIPVIITRKYLSKWNKVIRKRCLRYSGVCHQHKQPVTFTTVSISERSLVFGVAKTNAG